jgi:hypothetical protein
VAWRGAAEGEPSEYKSEAYGRIATPRNLTVKPGGS